MPIISYEEPEICVYLFQHLLTGEEIEVFAPDFEVAITELGFLRSDSSFFRYKGYESAND